MDNQSHHSDQENRGIIVERLGPVTVITIDRPRAMNALDFPANSKLIESLRAFDSDPKSRVVVVTGIGDKAFCSGADLKTYTLEFARRTTSEVRRAPVEEGMGLGGITRGLSVRKPVIAAINGYAISGGLELCLACDIRIASSNAQFGINDTRRGFHPADGGLIRLPHIVGLGNAMEIFLSGEPITAQRALAMGLVNRVYDTVEQLRTGAVEFAQTVAKGAPLAQEYGKEVMLWSLGRPMSDGLGRESRSWRDLAGSHDLKEGTAAFAEKREPRFEGR